MSANRHIPTAGDTWGKKPNITFATLMTLSDVLNEKYWGKWRYAVEVCPNAVVKTVDNEADAIETIRRIRKSLNEKQGKP
jgi:hypothetical protein